MLQRPNGVGPQTQPTGTRKLAGAVGPDNGGGFPAPPYLQHRGTGMPVDEGATPTISQGATGPTDAVKPSTQQPGGGNAQTPSRLGGMQMPTQQGMPSAPPPPNAPLPGTDGQSAPTPPRGLQLNDVTQMANDTNGNIPTFGPQGQQPMGAGGGATPQNPYALSNLGGQIEQQLANPSAYNSDVVKQAYDYMKGDLEKTRDAGLANADVDAASRGMYYGTPGLQSREKVTADYNRGLGSMASQLAMDQARTVGSDRQNAMNNAFTFLGQANQMDQQDAELAALAAQLGMAGGPTYGTALGVPMPNVSSGGVDPAAYAALGGLLAGNGKKKQTKPPVEDNTNNVG